MSILIIDDSRDFRTQIAFFLNSDCHTDLLFAESVSQGLWMLRADDLEKAGRGVDLILMDIIMPEIDGIEGCRMMKSHEQLRDIPIIIITGKEDPEAIEKAFDAGAIDFITKPLNRIELISRVRSSLRLKHEMDRRKAKEQDLVETARKLNEANKKLRLLSTQDGLTGIANRRSFDERLEKEWNRAERSERPVSLLMADIDYFKAYNDTYGHQAGDECLKLVAMTLKASLKRPGDFLARYGGEEFVAVLPEIDSLGSSKVAEIMRSSVAALGITHARSKVSDFITISVGVATIVPNNSSHPAELLDKADRSLLMAKREGRNRICIHV